MAETILDVENLRVRFATPDGEVSAVCSCSGKNDA